MSSLLSACAPFTCALVRLALILASVACFGRVEAGLTPFGGVVRIAANESHSCALSESGAVRCWGSNGFGQLGDGTTIDRRTPVSVVGLESGVREISVGDAHTCALSDAGAVKCWGRNAFGQLGDGTTTQRLVPTQVSGLVSGIAAIDGGDAFTCALNASGGVLCWGSNFLGGLGNNGGANSSVPGLVSGLSSGVQSISAGGGHACAAKAATGALVCWGYNLGGQLGDGTTTTRRAPVSVSGLTSGVASVDAGVLHTCAVTTGGAAKCWGNNFNGQLGEGGNFDRFVPTDVSGLGTGVAEVVTGRTHSCARTVSGAIKCWGSNYFGQLGIGSQFDSQFTPVDVVGVNSGAQSIAAGYFHTCALVGGVPKCWGYNEQGQVGNGTVALPTFRLAPVDVEGLSSGVRAIAAGDQHTCALTSNGAVRCWGKNLSGQIGDGTLLRRFAPATVTGLAANVQSVVAGSDHSCARSSGGVQCWGSNRFNQLGAPGNIDPHPPVTVSLTGTVTKISAGNFHTCVVKNDGSVSCWGILPFSNSGRPATILDLISGIREVAAGGDHNCVLTTADVVKCWGDNSSGQFGSFGNSSPYATVNIANLAPGITSISAGRDHTCAGSSSGEVACWGRNQYGEGGSPAPVTSFFSGSGTKAVEAGDLHNCALTAANGVKCWGTNVVGQLGDGRTTSSFQPVDVAGLGSGVQAISVGGLHACALTAAGGVKCWGDNEFGQSGDGVFPGVALPQAVLVDLSFFRSGFEAGEGD